MQSYLLKFNNFLLVIYGLAVVGAFAIMLFTGASTSSMIGLTAVLVLAPIFLLKTEYGLYTLLILRPMIDLFSGYGIISYRSISLNLTAVVAIMVLLWFVIVWLREKVQIANIPGIAWLVAFIGWGLVTLAISIDGFTTISEWLRLSSIVVVFVIAYHVASTRPHAITRLTPVVAIAMVIPLLVACTQLLTATGLSFGGLTNRVYGTFGHPNVLAFYLVCGISLLLVTQLSQLKEKRSLVYPWLIALGSLMLLFTYTRGAWIGFVVIQFIIGLIYYRKQLLILTGVLLGLFIFWQVINTVTINTFNYNLNDIELLHRLTSRDEESDSIDWRLEVFQTMSPYTLQSPLLGYGLGNFVTLRKQGDLGLFDDPEAHNDYLRIAVESGFVGIGFYLLFWISLVVALIHHFRAHQETSWQRRYALLGIALVIALLEMSIGDNLLQGTAVMWTYLAVIATILVETRPRAKNP